MISHGFSMVFLICPRLFLWFSHGFSMVFLINKQNEGLLDTVTATKGDIDSRRTHAPLAHSEQSLFLGLKPCLV